MSASARADGGPARSNPAEGPDTENMFGFTEGSDIGHKGEGEGEVETIGRFGRQASTYSVVSTTPTVKYGVTDQFRVAPAVTVSSYSVVGFAGTSDSNRLGVDALSLEFRYHPLDRASAPVGLTFVATPFAGFTNPDTGAPADRYGALLVAVVVRALIRGQLYAALNVSAFGGLGYPSLGTGIGSRRRPRPH